MSTYNAKPKEQPIMYKKLPAKITPQFLDGIAQVCVEKSNLMRRTWTRAKDDRGVMHGLWISSFQNFVGEYPVSAVIYDIESYGTIKVTTTTKDPIPRTLTYERRK